MNETAGIQDIRTSAIYDFDGVVERVGRDLNAATRYANQPSNTLQLHRFRS
jgi:hypothetical protein